MDNKDIVLTGKIDNPTEKIQIDHCCRRIMRKAHQEHFGSRPTLTDSLLHCRKKIDSEAQWHHAKVSIRDHDGVLMNRIGWTWTDCHVTRAKHREGQMRQSFFRANGHHGFAFRVKLDPVPPLIPIADRQSELMNSARRGIAMVLR